MRERAGEREKDRVKRILGDDDDDDDDYKIIPVFFFLDGTVQTVKTERSQKKKKRKKRNIQTDFEGRSKASVWKTIKKLIYILIG